MLSFSFLDTSYFSYRPIQVFSGDVVDTHKDFGDLIARYLGNPAFEKFNDPIDPNQPDRKFINAAGSRGWDEDNFHWEMLVAAKTKFFAEIPTPEWVMLTTDPKANVNEMMTHFISGEEDLERLMGFGITPFTVKSRTDCHDYLIPRKTIESNHELAAFLALTSEQKFNYHVQNVSHPNALNVVKLMHKTRDPEIIAFNGTIIDSLWT